MSINQAWSFWYFEIFHGGAGSLVRLAIHSYIAYLRIRLGNLYIKLSWPGLSGYK